MWAARSNHAAAAQALLEHGADVNARTRTGQAPARRLPLDGGGPGGGSHGLGIVRGGWPERGFQDDTPGGNDPAALCRSRRPSWNRAGAPSPRKPNVNQDRGQRHHSAAHGHHQRACRCRPTPARSGRGRQCGGWWGRTPLWAAVEIRNLDDPRSGDRLRSIARAGSDRDTRPCSSEARM